MIIALSGSSPARLGTPPTIPAQGVPQTSIASRFERQRERGGQAATASPAHTSQKRETRVRRASCGEALSERLAIGDHQLLDLGFVTVLSGFLNADIPPRGEVVIRERGEVFGHRCVPCCDDFNIGHPVLACKSYFEGIAV